MKRLLLPILTLFLSSSAMATGQSPDIIYVKGKMWALMGRPLADDSAMNASIWASFPESGLLCVSSANWTKYTGYWSVHKGHLILDSILYLNGKCKKTRLPDTTMHRLFKDHYVDGRIVAHWVNDTLRLAKGDCIYYQHIGFYRYYDTEMLLTLQNGKVTSKHRFLNRFVKKGFSLSNPFYEQEEHFRSVILPIVEQYKELDSISHLVFNVSGIELDSEGHLLKLGTVEMPVGRWYNDTLLAPLQSQLEHELYTLLLNIPNWEVWHINGKYIHPGDGWFYLWIRKPNSYHINKLLKNDN